MCEQCEALKARIEQLEVQLAGCGVAALGGDKKARIGDYGWSGSYQQVLKLREMYESALKDLEQLRDLIKNLAVCEPGA